MKWLLPLLLVGVLAGVLTMIFLAGLRNSDVARLALARASSNPTAIQRLGQPLKSGWLTTGYVDRVSEFCSAKLTIPLSGPKGRGTLFVYAECSNTPNNPWALDSLELEMVGESTRIDLLKPLTSPAEPTSSPSSNSAPPSQPSSSAKTIPLPKGMDPSLANSYGKALAGDPSAMFEIAYAYYSGKGVPKQKPSAVEWFRKAAEAGNVQAMFNLGIMYDKGDGIKKDLKQAFAWYSKSAEAGQLDGMHCVGNMYETGDGVARDYTQAVNWYRKAADGGQARAMNSLGDAYLFGHGVPKDPQQATTWYRKAAQAGDQDAKAALKRLGENPE